MLPPLRELTLLAPQYLLVGVGLSALIIAALLRKQLKPIAALLFLLASFSLALGLSRPAKTWTKSSTELSALVDISASMTPEGRGELLQALTPYFQGDRTIRLIPFGRTTSRSEFTLRSRSDVSDAISTLRNPNALVDTGDTNLGAAIQQEALRRPGSPLLLLSDGYETSGNSKQAARLAASRGVSVFPIIRNESLFTEQGLSITSLYAPLTANAGDLAEVRATIRNSDTTRAIEGPVEIFLGEKKLTSQKITVPPGEERVITVKTPAIEGGLQRIRAALSNPIPGRLAQERHRWISGKARSKILLLSGSAEDARVLRQLYSLKGFLLEEIVADGSQEIPKEFQSYTSVLLNNVALRQLPSGFLGALKRYVEDGGGLLLIGGDRSYGLGGYIDTPLEEISPLKFVPPQTKKQRLTNGVVLLVDKSRSMASSGKIEAARDAALISVNTLKDDDQVAVIGFDSAPFVIIRLSPVGDVKPLASRRLQNLTAAGRTDLLPALAMARQSLTASSTSRRHIIILSDGVVPESGSEYFREIDLLRQAGITVSCVAVGGDADTVFMQAIAKRGGGAFYYTVDPRRLPEIFLQDIKVSTGEQTLKERSEFPTEPGPDGIVSTSIRDFPPLRGYVETRPKKGATLELVTPEGGAFNPILASWKVGSGKVTAYTSDANGRWSLPWLNWGGFSRFWTDLLENVQNTAKPKEADVSFDFRSSVQRRELLFDLAIFDSRLSSGSSPRVVADVLLPGGEKRSVIFSLEKAGRFLASLDNARPGDYKLEITYGAVKLPPVAVTIPGEAFGEVAGKGINVQNLNEIAAISGGVINPDPARLQTQPATSSEEEIYYRPFALLAFILGVMGILFRELGGALILKLIQNAAQSLFRRR